MLYFFFENFLNSVAYTFGAFVPVFIIMCIHYQVRKRHYKKKKERLEEIRNMYKNTADFNDNLIREIYKSVGVKDFQELIDKNISISFINRINELFKEETKNRDESNNLFFDIRYLENYNFKTYISNLLDKNFPDRRFN